MIWPHDREPVLTQINHIVVEFYERFLLCFVACFHGPQSGVVDLSKCRVKDSVSTASASGAGATLRHFQQFPKAVIRTGLGARGPPQ